MRNGEKMEENIIKNHLIDYEKSLFDVQVMWHKDGEWSDKETTITTAKKFNRLLLFILSPSRSYVQVPIKIIHRTNLIDTSDSECE